MATASAPPRVRLAAWGWEDSPVLLERRYGPGLFQLVCVWRDGVVTSWLSWRVVHPPIAQGEDGEAGDPGAAGALGRMVSLFARSKAPSNVLPHSFILFIAHLCSFATLGGTRRPGGEGRHGPLRVSRSTRSQRTNGGGRGQRQLCKNHHPNTGTMYIYIYCHYIYIYSYYIYIQDCLRKLEYCDKVLYFL